MAAPQLATASAQTSAARASPVSQSTTKIRNVIGNRTAASPVSTMKSATGIDRIPRRRPRMQSDLATIARSRPPQGAANDPSCTENPVRSEPSHDPRQVERCENQYPPDDRQHDPPRQRDTPWQPFIRSEAPTPIPSPWFRAGVLFRQSDLPHFANGVSSWSLCEIQRHGGYPHQEAGDAGRQCLAALSCYQVFTPSITET